MERKREGLIRGQQEEVKNKEKEGMRKGKKFVMYTDSCRYHGHKVVCIRLYLVDRYQTSTVDLCLYILSMCGTNQIKMVTSIQEEKQLNMVEVVVSSQSY